MIRRAQATADDDRLRTLESVLGCLSVAVVALDRDARVVAVNSAFAHLHIHKGVCPAVGSAFVSFLRPEDHRLFDAALEAGAAGKPHARFAALSTGLCRLDISLTVWRDDYFIVEVIADPQPSPRHPVPNASRTFRYGPFSTPPVLVWRWCRWTVVGCGPMG
jgi:PAS domain-containing protein